jgi:class 3 adenylate cyclase
MSALNFLSGLLMTSDNETEDIDENVDFEKSLARHVLMSPTIDGPNGELGSGTGPATEDGNGGRRVPGPFDAPNVDSPVSATSSMSSFGRILEPSDLLPPLTWELTRCLEFDPDYDAQDLEELANEDLSDIDADTEESDFDDDDRSDDDEGTVFAPHDVPSIVDLAAEAEKHRREKRGSMKETIAQAWSHIKEEPDHEDVGQRKSVIADRSEPVISGAPKLRVTKLPRRKTTRFGSTGSLPHSELHRLSSSDLYLPPRVSPLTTPPEHLELDPSGRLPHSMRAAYHEEEVMRAITATLLMCPMFGLLQLTFLYNDRLYFSTKPFYPRLMAIRLTTATLFMLVALRAYLLQLHIVKVPRSKTDDPGISNARIILTWATFGLAAFNTDLIILTMPNPATSPYWVGFNLILLSLFMTRPFSYRPLIEFACFIVFQHLFITWWFDPLGARQPAFTSRAIFLLAMVVVGALGSAQLETLRRMEFLARKDLRRQKDWSAKLLHSVLPSPIARELEASGRVMARDLDDATIMFSDFVGFTSISAVTSAGHLVKALDRLFAVFDIIISRHRLEKLKTIGDAYMCAAGLVDMVKAPHGGFLHLVDAILAALEMIGWLESGGFRPKLPSGAGVFGDNVGATWQIRIGIHRGPVTAGVIGRSRFAYDCWGSTVNIASRLEGSSVPGRINITSEVFAQVAHLFEGTQRGKIKVKNLPFGEVEQTFLDRIRPWVYLKE